MKGIQTGCPWPLEPVAAIECETEGAARQLESHIHQHIDQAVLASEEYKYPPQITPLQGEWYEGVDAVVSLFREIVKDRPTALHLFKDDRVTTDLCKWRAAFRQEWNDEIESDFKVRPMQAEEIARDYLMNCDGLGPGSFSDGYISQLLKAS